MAITRPTGEQLHFNSAKTGTHVLDDYLEAVEAGNRTLSDLIGEIFDDATGDLKAFDFRIFNNVLQYKVGTGSWENVVSYQALVNTINLAKQQTETYKNTAVSARDTALSALDDINQKFTISVNSPTASDGDVGDVWFKVS